MLGRTYGRILDFVFVEAEQDMVTKWPDNRFPGLILVGLRIVFQAGAVGNGSGPQFGRKPAPNRPNLKSIFEFPTLSPSYYGHFIDGGWATCAPRPRAALAEPVLGRGELPGDFAASERNAVAVLWEGI